jgi:hypothetical protein
MTDAAPLRVNANDPIGFRAEKFEIAVKQTFTLPDSKTVISSTREESGAVKVDLPGGFQLVFTPRTETARVSPYGIVNEDRAVRQPIQAVSTSSNLESLTATQLWIAIYALWIRNYEEDVIPVSGLSEDLTLYLTHSGLGFIPDHDSKTERHVLLIRESFWQNAGPESNGQLCSCEAAVPNRTAAISSGRTIVVVMVESLSRSTECSNDRLRGKFTEDPLHPANA